MTTPRDCLPSERACNGPVEAGLCSDRGDRSNTSINIRGSYCAAARMEVLVALSEGNFAMLTTHVPENPLAGPLCGDETVGASAVFARV